MKKTEVRGQCPICYRRMIAATDPFGDETPQHGDIALCRACGEFAMFDFTRRRNTLRVPTVRERLDIDRNARAQRLLSYRAEQLH